MSDRRTKERERVWGRRPVILRFDSGHKRPNIESNPPAQSSVQLTDDILAALFQSVIQTNSMNEPSRAAEKRQPEPDGWFLVEPGESKSSAVRTPITIESPQPEMELEEDPGDTLVLTEQPQPKPKTRSFWRLQSPHLPLNVFPPK